MNFKTLIFWFLTIIEVALGALFFIVATTDFHIGLGLLLLCDGIKPVLKLK